MNLRQINSGLEHLRHRLFGDEQPGNEAAGPAELKVVPPLEAFLAETSIEVDRALEQISAIHNRL